MGEEQGRAGTSCTPRLQRLLCRAAGSSGGTSTTLASGGTQQSWSKKQETLESIKSKFLTQLSRGDMVLLPDGQESLVRDVRAERKLGCRAHWVPHPRTAGGDSHTGICEPEGCGIKESLTSNLGELQNCSVLWALLSCLAGLQKLPAHDLHTLP